jgi:serine/threonine protein kinase
MYRIGKYSFAGFKHIPGHRANYAVLPKSENNTWGMKYSASYSYASEYDILDMFSHPQIPKRCDLGKEIFFENGNPIFKMHYIVLQHHKGVDIVEYYKKNRLPGYLKISEIVHCFSSISDPLQYIHSKGYIHTDIKPGHLILDPSTRIISLIDLELAVKMGEHLKGMTVEYASPE